MSARRWGNVGVAKRETRVFLNLYDLHNCNGIMRAVGLGVYHSGVEVHDNEWTFAGGGGVFPHEPKRPPGDGGAFVVLHSTIEIGITTASAADVERITRKLESRFFGPETYNILHHNCNHFSNALCTELTGRGIPGRVNRLANMTSPCSECKCAASRIAMRHHH